MINYLIINITLCTAALAINQWLQIPHRIRFYALMVAVAAWLIPFGLMDITISQNTALIMPAQVIELSQPINAVNQVVESSVNFTVVLAFLFLIGLMLLFRDFILSHNFIKILKHNSTPLHNDQQIRVTAQINGAFVSGYKRPIIWISQNFLHEDHLQTVIRHEKQHIQSHDQYWLLIITFVQRVFWFNPLAYLVCHKCRQAIELSCDEICKQDLGANKYQTHLAQIMLQNSQSKNNLLINSINHNKNFNLTRIEQLNQENTMNQSNKIKLSLITLTIFVFCMVSLTTVATSYDVKTLNNNDVMIRINWKFTQTKSGMPYSSEINSDIVVNDEYRTFELSDYKVDVKARLANKGTKPKAYFIETRIKSDTNYPVHEPKIMAEAGKTATIRMVDTESGMDVKPQLEMNFTVLTEAQIANIKSNASTHPIAPIPASEAMPATTPKVAASPKAATTASPAKPVPPAPMAETPEPAIKPTNPPAPPKVDTNL